jgi:hypothetical protein
MQSMAGILAYLLRPMQATGRVAMGLVRRVETVLYAFGRGHKAQKRQNVLEPVVSRVERGQVPPHLSVVARFMRRQVIPLGGKMF